MKIGAYQFHVTGNIACNFQKIQQAITQAANNGIRLLIFPECALTGYPPKDIPHSAAVDFEKVRVCCDVLGGLAVLHDMHLIVGSVTEAGGKYFNSAIVFSPDKRRTIYHKRALWGWDRENFCTGTEHGVMVIDGVKIGIRICFEVRFPEYFRELYLENTNLNIILFYDVSDWDDLGRYDLIKGHIRTRAVENVCRTLSVDATAPYQTAPTGLYDMSGNILCELERSKEGMLVHDLQLGEMDFGEQGRREISDQLTKQNRV